LLAQGALPVSLIKKRITLNFSKVPLKLDVSESLFSSFDVDVGTKAASSTVSGRIALSTVRVFLIWAVDTVR